MNATYTTISIPQRLSVLIGNLARAKGKAKWEIIEDLAKKEQEQEKKKDQEFFDQQKARAKKFMKGKKKIKIENLNNFLMDLETHLPLT